MATKRKSEKMVKIPGPIKDPIKLKSKAELDRLAKKTPAKKTSKK